MDRNRCVQFSECYYQEEALYAAMRYWIAHAFNSKEPAIEVAFDKQSNRYLFYNKARLR